MSLSNDWVTSKYMASLATKRFTDNNKDSKNRHITILSDNTGRLLITTLTDTVSCCRVFVNETCNSNCQCDVNRFLPVCGDDGRSYFSACYAGCTTESFNETMQVNYMIHRQQCLIRVIEKRLVSHNNGSTVIQSYISNECLLLTAYSMPGYVTVHDSPRPRVVMHNDVAWPKVHSKS